MSIFPFIQPQVIINEQPTELPLYKEVAWDFEKNVPVFRSGAPYITEGAEAVLTWAWKALNTERFKHIIYTWNFGNEVDTLVGQIYTMDLKISEARRYIEECLLVNPYITKVTNIEVGFSNDIVSISCTLETIYGEIKLNRG